MGAPTPVVAVICDSRVVASRWLDVDLGAERTGENQWTFAGLTWRVFSTANSMRGHRFLDAVYVAGSRPQFYDEARFIVSHYSVVDSH